MDFFIFQRNCTLLILQTSLLTSEIAGHYSSSTKDRKMGHFPFQHSQQLFPAWKQTDLWFGYCQQLQKSEADIYNWAACCPEHIKESISSWMLLSSFLQVKLNFSCSTVPLTAASTPSVVEDSYFLIRTQRQQRNHGSLNIRPFSHFTDFNGGLQYSHSKNSKRY